MFSSKADEGFQGVLVVFYLARMEFGQFGHNHVVSEVVLSNDESLSTSALYVYAYI